jgi:hypothetical protein
MHSRTRPKPIDRNTRMLLVSDPSGFVFQDEGQAELAQAKQRRLIDLPVPAVTDVSDYAAFTAPGYRQPRAYIRRVPVIDRAALADRPDAAALDEAVVAGCEYDVDAEDEAWLAAHVRHGAAADPSMRLSWAGFEWLVERLEQQAGSVGVVPSPADAAAIFGPELVRAAQEQEPSAAARAPLLPPACLPGGAAAGAVRRLIEDVARVWTDKRARLKKPLLRRFWPATGLGDKDPHHTFRPQGEKETYKLRRTRKNDGDSLLKLRTLVEDVACAAGIMDLLRARELLKRDLAAASLDYFHAQLGTELGCDPQLAEEGAGAVGPNGLPLCVSASLPRRLEAGGDTSRNYLQHMRRRRATGGAHPAYGLTLLTPLGGGVRGAGRLPPSYGGYEEAGAGAVGGFRGGAGGRPLAAGGRPGGPPGWHEGAKAARPGARPGLHGPGAGGPGVRRPGGPEGAAAGAPALPRKAGVGPSGDRPPQKGALLKGVGAGAAGAAGARGGMAPGLQGAAPGPAGVLGVLGAGVGSVPLLPPVTAGPVFGSGALAGAPVTTVSHPWLNLPHSAAVVSGSVGLGLYHFVVPPSTGGPAAPLLLGSSTGSSGTQGLFYDHGISTDAFMSGEGKGRRRQAASGSPRLPQAGSAGGSSARSSGERSRSTAPFTPPSPPLPLLLHACRCVAWHAGGSGSGAAPHLPAWVPRAAAGPLVAAPHCGAAPAPGRAVRAGGPAGPGAGVRAAPGRGAGPPAARRCLRGGGLSRAALPLPRLSHGRQLPLPRWRRGAVPVGRHGAAPHAHGQAPQRGLHRRHRLGGR